MVRVATIYASDFVKKVMMWAVSCFGLQLATDKTERNERFLEEALELVQSTGMTREAAHKLVDYVFSREVGDSSQEVAGTMISLAALCYANKINIDEAVLAEMRRITSPEIMEKVRNKQKLKPRFGAQSTGVQTSVNIDTDASNVDNSESKS